MLGVGDRVKIVFSPRRKYQQLFVGQEGTIIHYVGHSPGLVVRFENGRREPFYKDELEPLHKPRETPLLVDALGDAAKLLLEKMDNIGDGMLFNLDILDARELLRKAMARYKEEVSDA